MIFYLQLQILDKFEISIIEIQDLIKIVVNLNLKNVLDK